MGHVCLLDAAQLLTFEIRLLTSILISFSTLIFTQSLVFITATPLQRDMTSWKGMWQPEVKTTVSDGCPVLCFP